MRPQDGRCAVCGLELEIGPGWWRCRRPGHPAGATMPVPTLGELWGSYGRAWGVLDQDQGRGVDRGWRTAARQAWRAK